MLSKLEGTARYAGLLLAPVGARASAFGQGFFVLKLFAVFAYFRPFLVFSSVVTLVTFRSKNSIKSDKSEINKKKL